jgi:hypothetical protein
MGGVNVFEGVGEGAWAGVAGELLVPSDGCDAKFAEVSGAYVLECPGETELEGAGGSTRGSLVPFLAGGV